MAPFPRALVLAAVGASLLAAGPTARAQAGGPSIRGYDVEIGVQRDGSILVVERIAYDFDGLARHGIFRDIPVRLPYSDRYDRVYMLDDLSVTGSPGTPAGYKIEHQGSTLLIRSVDPKKLISGSHLYTITYRVRGALNGFSDHDELYWNAIGTLWDVPIARAVVRVTAPAPIGRVACFSGPSRSSLPCDRDALDGSSATFTQASLGPMDGLTVVVGFRRGAVPSPKPILKERWSFGRAFAVRPVTAGVAAILLLLLLAGLGRLIWAVGRDRRYLGSPVDVAYGSRDGREQTVPLMERAAIVVEFAPPDGMRPGQVGTLIDEVANPLDVTATIVDLAVRGYLRIEEIPKEGWFGRPDWRLVKLKAGADLLPYERILFDGLFGAVDEDEASGDDHPDDVETAATALPTGGLVADPLATVKLSDLKRHFATRLARVEEALYDDAVGRGWFAARPDKVRRRWTLLGLGGLAAGIVLVWLVAARTHLVLVPIPIVIGGVLLLAAAHRMPRRTPKGTGLRRRVLGFRMYIETAEVREAQFAERENLFSRYLPFAIVFGCTQKWAKAFAGLDLEAATAGAWYVGAYPFTVAALASSIDGFTVNTAGTIAASASSGSSGFGGGGVGGGGGGGGGGSW